jgi:Flp pilus assembly protein TadG
MNARWSRIALSRLRMRDANNEESGYVAVTVAIMLTVMLSFCAFAVDVGNWYYVGQRAQRAADAAALAGVTNLPNDPTTAYTVARAQATKNDFTAGMTTSVTPSVDGRPTRLRVTISETVKNNFGWLMGMPTKTITKTAVADYAGPVPMGSPCNEFGNDPDATSSVRSSTCNDVSGKLWANVNSQGSLKANGDPFQSGVCSAGVDGCTGASNTEYQTHGYFYVISVKKAGPVKVELFDPVYVDTGLSCDEPQAFSGNPKPKDADNDVVSDEAQRYAEGTTDYCTGDANYSGNVAMKTRFVLRAPSDNAWDPTSFPQVCAKTYKGYKGPLYQVLDQYVDNKKSQTRPTYDPDIVDGFRRWTTLCTVDVPKPGDYQLQVLTNGLGTDNADAGNRFAIRATGADNDAIAISGRETMSIYSNKPGATTGFYLARVGSGGAGLQLKIRLFDVGDSKDKNGNVVPGTISILKPPDAAGSALRNCIGAGPISGTLSACSFTASSNTHQGKWQEVTIPIPANYSCDDRDPSACWFRLEYDYKSKSIPTDVTTWAASLEGDPVRLVE